MSSRDNIQAGPLTMTGSTTDRGPQQGDLEPIHAPDGLHGPATTGPVKISSPGAIGVVEFGDRKSSIAASDGDMTRAAVPIPFAAATQRTFAAAGDQFNALARFGSDRTALSPKDRAQATADRRTRYESLFVRDGFIQLDQHRIHDILEFLRADDAIRAKAAALGYGAQSHAVPVTSVPGGYVGRFGGHDIYVATT